MKWTFGVIGASLAVCSLVATARATIQPILMAINPSGADTVFSYQIELTPNNGLAGGTTEPSALVILDFPGVVGTPTLISSAGDVTSTGDWSISTEPTGAGTLPMSSFLAGTFSLVGDNAIARANDGTDTNVILQYMGSGVPVVTGPDNELLLQLNITAAPTTENTTVVQALSRDTTPTINQVESFPVMLVNPAGATPEPAALSLLALGMAGALLRRRR